MGRWLLAHEAEVLSAAYYGWPVVVMLAELLAPRRRSTQPVMLRWLGHAGLAVINNGIHGWISLTIGLLAAEQVARHNLGLVPMMSLPGPLAAFAAIVLLDLMGYGQHRISHAVPVLWRLHVLHHSDLDLDVTTSLRHHPADFALTSLFTIVAVALVGAPPVAVVLFSVAVIAANVFHHGNVRIPGGAEPLLRRLLVTPDMHAVHHSMAVPETNSNYGVLFPWWDRIFGSYVLEPAAGHDRVRLGLEYFRQRRDAWIPYMLAQPVRAFRAEVGAPDRPAAM